MIEVWCARCGCLIEEDDEQFYDDDGDEVCVDCNNALEGRT